MKKLMVVMALGLTAFGGEFVARQAATAAWAAESPAGGCPSCGCQAGHCGAGIPGHFGCSERTPADRQRVQDRVDRLNRAAVGAISPDIARCNQLVQKIAGSMGYRGFDNLTADQMLERLAGSEDNIRRSVSEGWTFLSPDATRENPKPMTIDEAMQYANAGRLVVALVHSGMRNQVKPSGDNGGNAYTHGHTFVILPGGKSGDGWRGAPVANAGSGRDPGARKTTANMVVKEWERPIITFWALSN